MSKIIAALNSLNTPWVAILVIILGMFFDIACKREGISADAATGVIGAGIGLLTGQALNNKADRHDPLAPPVDPAQPKE